MCWYELDIEPRDVLFFRDAKPMEASSVGSGANWPLPNVLHDALIHALNYRWRDKQPWEFDHKHPKLKENRPDAYQSVRFGGLRTAGVFPYYNGTSWFPCPADIDPDGQLMMLENRPKHSNLPGLLEKVCIAKGKSGKKKAPVWMPAEQLCEYAEGKSLCFPEKGEPLYDVEARPGIGINPETGSADTGGEEEGGKFYLAEYMRLRPEVNLKGFAQCESSLHGEKKTDVLKKFFESKESVSLIFGGQRGVAHVCGRRTEKPLCSVFEKNKGTGCLVKWVLLAPAVFAGGWKPGWVDDSGKVMLPAEKPKQEPGESREQWRARFKEIPPISAKLIATKTEKPLAFSGWNLRLGGPRPTMLAVPAGSVYWFRADSLDDAAALVAALQGHCRSDFYGEKGFGLGFCVQQES